MRGVGPRGNVGAGLLSSWSSHRRPFPVGGAQDGPVAQLDRAFGYEPKGREFKSLRGHHSRTAHIGPDHAAGRGFPVPRSPRGKGAGESGRPVPCCVDDASGMRCSTGPVAQRIEHLASNQTAGRSNRSGVTIAVLHPQDSPRRSHEASVRDTRHSRPFPGVRNHRVARDLTAQMHPSTRTLLGRRVSSLAPLERCTFRSGLSGNGPIMSTIPGWTRHARYAS